MIYFPKATHVALYLGDGKVVQAPRTGEKIQVSPIATYPILGAVRPDGRPKGARGAARSATRNHWPRTPRNPDGA